MNNPFAYLMFLALFRNGGFGFGHGYGHGGAGVAATQGMAFELGKYYTQYGVVYECIPASGALVYDLKDVPALARPVG